ALLAQGRTARRRRPVIEDHQTAAEDLVRLPRDLAGLLSRRLEAQADRRRAGADDARLRKAFERGTKRRARFSALPHEAPKLGAYAAPAASNCFDLLEQRSSKRRPLTLTQESFLWGRRDEACGDRAVTRAVATRQGKPRQGKPRRGK